MNHFKILPLGQEEGRIPTIFSQTSGEFIYMGDMLESTHNKNNGQTEVLLQAIHNFIWRCQEYWKKGTLSPAQKCMLSQWQNLDWANMPKYSTTQAQGKWNLMVSPKTELCNKKIACFSTTRAEGHQKMFLEVAWKMGHLTGDIPHTQLGNMSPSCHEDHPLVWME